MRVKVCVENSGSPLRTFHAQSNWPLLANFSSKLHRNTQSSTNMLLLVSRRGGKKQKHLTGAISLQDSPGNKRTKQAVVLFDGANY